MPGPGEHATRLTEVFFEDAPFQRAHWKVAIGATTGYISDGYTLGVVGIALAAAQAALSLNPLWLGVLGGGSLAGLFVGALISGSFADRFGRRPIYACNMIFFAALSLLQLLVTSPLQLLLLRFALGIVLGTDYVICKALLLEFMPRNHRGRALSMMGVAWACGYALAYLTGYSLKDTGPSSWRLILASSAIPAMLTIPLRWGVPESPLWLVCKGRRREAQQILDSQLGTGFLLPAVDGSQPADAPPWKRLLSARYRGVTALASVLFFCLVVPYFAVGTFIPQVMGALHVAGSDLAALIYILCLLVGAIAGFVVVDWFPRRLFVMGSFAITAVTLCFSAMPVPLPGYCVVISFCLFSGVLSAAQTQIYVYLPELFPTTVRASGLGVAVAVSRVGAAAGTFLLPVCMQRLGIHVTLYLCVAILALGGLSCYRWAPETRHSRLARDA